MKRLVQIPLKSCSYPIVPEQKARSTYDNLLRLIDDPDVREPLKFLREREVVHFQRFGDALSVVQSNLDAKNYYAWNPAFDVRPRERSAPAPSRTNKPLLPDPVQPCLLPARGVFLPVSGRIFRLIPFIFRKFYILLCLSCLFLHIFCTI